MVLPKCRRCHRLELKQFGHTKKERDFQGGGFRRVRSVHGISLDIFREALTNGTFRCICGVGGAHYIAPMFDGIVALERQDNHRSFGHKIDQTREEGLLAMDLIKSLGLLLGKPDHFHTADPEAGFFDHSENLAGVSAGDSIGFDNCKGLLDWHYVIDGS
jgi:hypothetical protein